jgi:hypothetical protein
VGIPVEALACVAIPVGFIVLFFTVACLERRSTRPYLPAQGSFEAANDPYLSKMATAMLQHGFLPAGLGRQQSKLVSVNIAFWISPDALSFAITGAGKVAGNAVKQTWLYSQLPDGRFVITTDANDAGDLSGMFITGRYVATSFEKLYRYHQSRLEKFPELVAWPPEASLETINDILQRRAERVVELRRGAWANAEKTKWHMTPLGAFLSLGQFFTQFFAAVTSPRRILMGE